jgi:alcohol dehydrogenase
MTPDAYSSLPPLAPFDYQPRTRIIFGVNSVERVGEVARDLPAKRILLVTDRGIVAAGHAVRVSRLLEASGLSISCFDQAEENPSVSSVGKCLEFARRSEIEAIVALGGGSSMDTAKGCNFLLTNGGQMQDYWGVSKAKHPMLPLVAIPTTAGTGSECQSFALITDDQTHQKMACGDPKVAARVAILDPALTLSQPARVTASTGIDALAHALETAVTRKRTSLSLLFSRAAFRLTMAGLPRVIQAPGDLEARGRMLLGAAWAGIAIENSMLGAAHSAANPLSAHFGITHGQAVGLMLPHVVRFNAAEPVVAQIYAEFAGTAHLEPLAGEPRLIAQKLANRLDRLLQHVGLSRSLSDLGVRQEDLPRLAEEAAAQWTAQFNPRPVAASDFRHLYAQALVATERPAADFAGAKPPSGDASKPPVLNAA